MKVACLQFSPELGQLEDNIRKAESIIARSNLPVDLDWLVLPEMAFSGYDFHTLAEISPFLEPTASGRTTLWAQATAQKLNCHITVGYPERTTTDPITQYNSTVTVSPSGAVLSNYRKTFLYYTDETWASEGDSKFFSGGLGALGQVTLGICMDINPYKFIAPWDKYEFAAKALADGSQIVCVSMAWLCTLSAEELVREPDKADITTIAYWVERFHPIVDVASEKPVYVVLANRCGQEKAVCYAGSTTVLKIERGGVSLFDMLGKGEEKCLIVDLDDRPKYQLKNAER